MKKRAVKNRKHRLAKAIRRIRRTGDDWSDLSNKQFLETDRNAAKKQISRERIDG